MADNKEKTRKLKIYSIISIAVMIIAIAGIYLWSYKNSQPASTFDVSFTVKEIEITENSTGYHRRLAPYYDAWDIRVYKLTDDMLRNVDIWAYGQDGFKIVRHYDYLGGKQVIPIGTYHIKNRTMIVDIYWEGGYEGFYCNPWE